MGWGFQVFNFHAIVWDSFFGSMQGPARISWEAAGILDTFCDAVTFQEIWKSWKIIVEGLPWQFSTQIGSVDEESMSSHFLTIQLYKKLPIYRPSGRYVIRYFMNLDFGDLRDIPWPTHRWLYPLASSWKLWIMNDHTWPSMSIGDHYALTIPMCLWSSMVLFATKMGKRKWPCGKQL